VSETSLSQIKVYKTKPFSRFARKARISDNELWNAAVLADEGVVDADLGGGVIKQRIARAGEGKSGGSRSIIVFRRGDRAVYVYGFEKKDQAKIRSRELEAFRKLAKLVLGYTLADMAREIAAGEFINVRPIEESDDA
jgi:hypothetical protein